MYCKIPENPGIFQYTSPKKLSTTPFTFYYISFIYATIYEYLFHNTIFLVTYMIIFPFGKRKVT